MPLYEGIAEKLASAEWLSTQETAYALLACAPVLQNSGRAAIPVDITLGGAKQSVTLSAPATIIELGTLSGSPDEGVGAATFQVENKSDSPVYVRAIVRGTPEEGRESEVSNGIALSVEYRLFNNADNPVTNPQSLPPGSDMEVRVTVRNTSADRELREIALENILPASYEILNTRIGNSDTSVKQNSYKYQDIRDDRVLSYFDIPRSSTKTVSFIVNRAYEGSFYSPPIRAYAMYDESIAALRKQ
jgi:uncharacterized protein YfaS (alpha-2-macroglobulin family)